MLIFAMAFGRLEALTVAELLADPKLTPKRFANHFERFGFEFHREVQTPERFLMREAGDCDDYAILADFVLGQKGFETRLVHVRVVGMQAHAVCYVRENKGYLDYNNRRYSVNLERSGPTLREIAEKVARSLEGNWSSASEFVYDYAEARKSLKQTVVKTDPPSHDADRK